MTAPATTLLAPGDFEVVKIAGAGGGLISFGEWANGAAAFTTWDHARAYLGRGMWLQAEPSGAQIVHLGDQPTPGGMCSAGIAQLALTPVQQGRAWDTGQALKGTPYSALDYLALAAHRLHIPAPQLRAYIAASGHEMCSQLVDTFRLRLLSHLFGPPGGSGPARWAGDVTPWDLGHLIASYGGKPTP